MIYEKDDRIVCRVLGDDGLFTEELRPAYVLDRLANGMYEVVYDDDTQDIVQGHEIVGLDPDADDGIALIEEANLAFFESRGGRF